MKNPIVINSANVNQFGFKSTFNLSDLSLTLDVDGLTGFIGSGASQINSIVFNVTDPSGFDMGDKALNLSTLVPVVYDLNPNFNFGFYTIKGTLVDQDGKPYVIKLDINICIPEKWDGYNVPGLFDIDVDCKNSTATIFEQTLISYLGKRSISEVKNGKIFYPDNVINELDFSFTPFMLGGGDGLFTGTYRIKNTTLATFDLNDNIFIVIPYFTRSEFEVTCENSLKSILCCIQDQYDIVARNKNNSKAVAATQLLNLITPDLVVALLKDQSGKNSDKEVARIKEVLNCDCGCNKSILIEPQIIGTPGSAVNVVGAGGTTVTPSSSGGTVLYTVRSRAYDVTKGDPTDLAFSIVKNEGPTSVTFILEFDYVELSQTILNTIAASDELTLILNQLITGTSSGSIANINGRCVIDLTTCDYSLIDSATPLKIVKNVVIGGVTSVAPSGLASTNAAGIATWLNGLGKGIFTASLNGSSTQLTILSQNNVNVLNSMLFDSNGTPLNRDFTRNCSTLSNVLQAVIDYVCELDTTQVDLSSLINLTTRVGSTVTTTPYPAGTTLQVFLEALGTAVSYYANNPIVGPPGTNGTNGISVQVFVQPGTPTGGSYRNGDIWIVQ